MAWIRAGRPAWRRYASVLVAGFVLVVASPASAAGKWKLEAGSTIANFTLSAVSCPSETWCAAVGKEGNNDAISKVYAESGNGSAWTKAPSSGPRFSWLFGVSCVARKWCQAVGWWDDARRPLNERWNGTKWSSVPSPVSVGRLEGVSCTSRAFCMAVGSTAKNNVGALVERWNGAKWSVVSTPRKGGGTALESVSCLTPKWCAAVGHYSTLGSRGYVAHSLVEAWNGKVWQIVPSPTPKGFTTLLAVDCVSSTWCMAVGYAQSGAVVEHWNGHAWTVMGHPTDKARHAFLRAVSCVSSKACVAVGEGRLAESWNAKAWSLMTFTDDVSSPSYLYGVSCPTAALCKAVGEGTAIETTG